MGSRNRVGRGLLYRPARLHTEAYGIDSLELIPALLKSLKIRALSVKFCSCKMWIRLRSLSLGTLQTACQYQAARQKKRGARRISHLPETVDGWDGKKSAYCVQTLTYLWKLVRIFCGQLCWHMSTTLYCMKCMVHCLKHGQMLCTDLCITRNETAQPRSQFLHACICEPFIYSQNRSAYLAATK
jgi:hypothetical protein